MILELSIVGIAGCLFYVLFIRRADLSSPQLTSPHAHLHERKSTIHENLRDLQFDFRTGKLSQADYQASKLALQTELGVVLLQMRDAPPNQANCCAACGEHFSRAMKFCGHCGKAVA